MTNMNETLKKAMATMFAQVENVSYDLATGKTGIKTDGGLVTLGDDGTLDKNPMDFFSMELPAFAMLTPAKDVKAGDIIVSSGKAYGFILEGGLKAAPARRSAKTPAATVDPEATAETLVKGELSTINVQGHVSRFRPSRVQMMGVSDGLTVVRSFANLFGGQTPTDPNNMMQMLMPMMLMSKSSGTGGKDMSSMLPMMMMMGGMGGQGGGMMSNPLMMMALMGDGGIDGFFKK